MRLAAWNVNSIRARQERLLAWLESRKPDVVCLQETKVEDAAFPFDVLRAAGYEAVHHGQKTYNGVAILARAPLAITDVRCGLGDGEDDPQARLIAATISGVRVLSVYIPNGEAPDSPKFDYKLRFLGRLRRHLGDHYSPDQPLVICGDFNVAPEARDVCDPVAWEETTLCHVRARATLAEVTQFGLIDTFREHVPDAGKFSWWDYRNLAFPKNQGLRIDLVLATPPLAARCTEASIDREARKGEKPSDHTPVMATFADQ